ncbi:DUF7288 family protein [Halosegnis marinus]|uniref:DUF7288 family protein n=1 Tax=Halosegnis marinus TaxID=3034023 RepID=UPI00361F7CC8
MNRGQARALEGVAAALLVVGAVVFALQSAVVTPLAASTTNQFLEDRQGTLASDTLDTAAAAGELRGTVRYWNLTSRTFDGARREGYVGGPRPRSATPCAGRSATAASRTTSTSPTGRATVRTRPAGWCIRGRPRHRDRGDDRRDAVRRRHAHRAREPERHARGTDGFYAPDAVSGPVYNVVEIRVVVWRA